MLQISKDQGGIVIPSILRYGVTFFIGLKVVTNKTSDCVEFKILGLGRRLLISSFKYVDQNFFNCDQNISRFCISKLAIV